MATMGVIVLGLIIFYFGFVLGWAGRKFIRRRAPYDGDINVIETEEKLIYSLELSDDAEKLKDKKEVLFKVNMHPSIGNSSH